MRTYWQKIEGDWKFICEDCDGFPADKKEIADVAIWTKTLTEAEIKALASGARPTTVAKEKLKEFYPLDAMVGTARNKSVL